ncbi:hypothetical protein [Streptomyces himalayensis]|uniref:Uncharacterized protein n=1 Tax=Streptomyces himalayensis subsp. himalayensis TaxID=2756131 RepID=A0A7W0DUH4_9ACTN|nr:hypothetical protein [Streptomyces himalayensis]MBA2951460.1 hypothetical protein [Streptomyces himalayensis subsp. himalayensis]
MNWLTRHWWSMWWPVRIVECPDGEPVVIEVWQRHCRLCRALDEAEVVLSCASS